MAYKSKLITPKAEALESIAANNKTTTKMAIVAVSNFMQLILPASQPNS